MRLSRFTDYALRAAMYLTAHEGRVVPISEIRDAHGLSHANLLKVVHKLVTAGILKSTRGRRGGVRLARPAEEITLGEIVRVMEGDQPMIDYSDCLLGAARQAEKHVRKARLAFYDSLDGVTLRAATEADPPTLVKLREAAPAVK